MKFIYRNQPQVTTLAGRNSGKWAAFTDDDRRAVKDYAKGARGERYRAINTDNDGGHAEPGVVGGKDVATGKN